MSFPLNDNAILLRMSCFVKSKSSHSYITAVCVVLAVFLAFFWPLVFEQHRFSYCKMWSCQSVDLKHIVFIDEKAPLSFCNTVIKRDNPTITTYIHLRRCLPRKHRQTHVQETTKAQYPNHITRDLIFEPASHIWWSLDVAMLHSKEVSTKTMSGIYLDFKKHILPVIRAVFFLYLTVVPLWNIFQQYILTNRETWLII